MAQQHVSADFSAKISLHRTAKYRLHARTQHITQLAADIQQHVCYCDCFEDFCCFVFFANAIINELD